MRWGTLPSAPLLAACLLALPGTPLGAQEVVVNPVGMELVRMEPGRMIAGRFEPTCPTPDPGLDADPRTRWEPEDYALCTRIVQEQSTPGFEVVIDRPFYIGRHEVTQEQWREVMGGNPSHFQGDRVEGDADRHPVEQVGWEEAVAFTRRLTELHDGFAYRLPTEFEWEYAARAGAHEEPSWATIREMAWIGLADHGTTRPVGQKAPNAWGLFDMMGNVWEWVADYHNGRTLPQPEPPGEGELRVMRGGSFLSDVKNATWFGRGAGPGNGWDVGFRVVAEPTDAVVR